VQGNAGSDAAGQTQAERARELLRQAEQQREAAQRNLSARNDERDQVRRTLNDQQAAANQRYAADSAALADRQNGLVARVVDGIDAAARPLSGDSATGNAGGNSAGDYDFSGLSRNLPGTLVDHPWIAESNKQTFDSDSEIEAFLSRGLDDSASVVTAIAPDSIVTKYVNYVNDFVNKPLQTLQGTSQLINGNTVDDRTTGALDVLSVTTSYDFFTSRAPGVTAAGIAIDVVRGGFSEEMAQFNFAFEAFFANYSPEFLLRNTDPNQVVAGMMRNVPVLGTIIRASEIVDTSWEQLKSKLTGR
jgi:hypothetical protein